MEYQACSLPCACWDLIREFMQGFLGGCVSSNPPTYIQVRVHVLTVLNDLMLIRSDRVVRLESTASHRDVMDSSTRTDRQTDKQTDCRPPFNRNASSVVLSQSTDAHFCPVNSTQLEILIDLLFSLIFMFYL